jgi:hypothetical protein
MSIDTANYLTPPHSLQGQKLWGCVKVFGTIHGREGCACVQGCPPNVTSLGHFFYDHVSTGIVVQGDARVTPRRNQNCRRRDMISARGGGMPWHNPVRTVLRRCPGAP